MHAYISFCIIILYTTNTGRNYTLHKTGRTWKPHRALRDAGSLHKASSHPSIFGTEPGIFITDHECSHFSQPFLHSVDSPEVFAVHDKSPSFD